MLLKKAPSFIAVVCFIIIGIFATLKLGEHNIMLRTTERTFRFHVRTDLDGFDPALTAVTISSYTMNVMHGALLKYQNHEIQSGGAKKCEALTPVQYVCELRDDWGWSDGAPVTATHILNGYNALVKEKSPRVQNFLNIRQLKVLTTKQGEKTLENKIEFTLYKPDADFLYRLLDPALSPRRDDVDMKSGRVTAGLYALKDRVPGRSFLLQPNTYYAQITPDPDVEVMIIDEDATAMRLYENRKLNFLRRVTADNVAAYEKSPQFMRVPFMRFDYIGFGPAVAANESLRRQLIYGLLPQYTDFAFIMRSLGPPGCFGLLDVLPHGNGIFEYDYCYGSVETDPKMAVAKTKYKAYTAAELKKLPKLSLHYSTWGDDDVRRGLEVFQHGWKKNLNLEVEMASEEQAVLTMKLKHSPPPLFRRGVNLERPTCLAALETFETGAPNNFIRYTDKQYDQLLTQMRAAQPETYNLFCKQALKILFEARRMIPMGAIHYAMLSDQKFDGFSINELNQLDVSGLRVKP